MSIELGLTWFIPSKAMPANSGRYIVCVDDFDESFEVTLDSFVKDGIRFYTWTNKEGQQVNPNYWMPRPKPPQAKNK